MKKQTENITRSCSYLLLKTLFYFISQCTSVPYLETSLCKLDNELDNCNFTFIEPRNRPFHESNYEVCKYKTLGYTVLFTLHIERPSYACYCTRFFSYATFMLSTRIDSSHLTDSYFPLEYGSAIM